MNRFIVGGTAVVTSVLLAASPTGACDRCSTGGVSDDGVLARARSQMAELNQGYGGNPAPNCNDEHDYVIEDGNDIVEYEGHLRWVPDFANDPTPPDGVSNEWYQQICYLPDMPPRTGQPNGASWLRFEYVAPELLARVAIDDVLAGIPTQTIETSPTTDAWVAIPTWFWITGVPAAGVSATASVPGVSVTATASPGGVNYDFGDGTSMECVGSGTPYSAGATSDCTHEYEQAGHYTIAATILWTGTYSVNGGAPIPIQTAVQRTATFDLPVVEAQAVNTGSGG